MKARNETFNFNRVYEIRRKEILVSFDDVNEPLALVSHSKLDWDERIPSHINFAQQILIGFFHKDLKYFSLHE